MHKIDICPFKIGKVKLGSKPGGTEDNIHRRNTTYPLI
jgi:hypothetical protein